jgi:hypothetical protein
MAQPFTIPAVRKEHRMMRRKITSIVAVAALAAAVLATAMALQVGVSDASAKGPGPGGFGGGQGPGTAHVPSDPSRPLTSADAAGLTFMREEEKLARDVHTLLGDKYHVRAFGNIARAESRHMAAIKRLMDIYSVPDPVGTNPRGVFADPVFTRLYEDLTTQGQQSLAGALRVGIAVENADIDDLQVRMSATDRADLKAVYGNLLRASENHLRAFTRLLGTI